ncbi:IS200/IS605 family transposase [Halomicronema sp. CCY15110]|uniref:IS200/IS605 family transposase n=1 Tax=Halomicronema sp. CCY15110 TaxID=2767773 RepID=UPI00194EF2F6|nr:IS200/IS605 family transposase [Halomicronema sp. CCY15110]
MQEYRKGAHSVFSIVSHTYFVTAYRRKCLTPVMIGRIAEVTARICVINDCIQLECDGEADQVHFMLDLHPKIAPSTLLGSMKAASSRILRKEFEPELRPHFRNWKKGLWGDQLYIRSAGGAPLETLKAYINAHSRGSK